VILLITKCLTGDLKVNGCGLELRYDANSRSGHFGTATLRTLASYLLVLVIITRSNNRHKPHYLLPATSTVVVIELSTVTAILQGYDPNLVFKMTTFRSRLSPNCLVLLVLGIISRGAQAISYLRENSQETQLDKRMLQSSNDTLSRIQPILDGEIANINHDLRTKLPDPLNLNLYAEVPIGCASLKLVVEHDYLQGLSSAELKDLKGVPNTTTETEDCGFGSKWTVLSDIKVIFNSDLVLKNVFAGLIGTCQGVYYEQPLTVTGLKTVSTSYTGKAELYGNFESTFTANDITTAQVLNSLKVEFAEMALTVGAIPEELKPLENNIIAQLKGSFLQTLNEVVQPLMIEELNKRIPSTTLSAMVNMAVDSVATVLSVVEPFVQPLEDLVGDLSELAGFDLDSVLGGILGTDDAVDDDLVDDDAFGDDV